MDKKINARKKAQRLARQRKMRNRRIALTICLMIAISLVSIGGTLAWLQATTGEVKNTFTVGDVDLTLIEHEYDFTNKVLTETEVATQSYPLTPGSEYKKDPTVTVTSDVDCWLFVQFDASESATYLTYESALDNAPWIKGTGVDANGVPTNVWYREVKAGDSVKSWHLITDDKIVVKDTIVDQDATSGLKMPTTAPTMTYKAYAVQKDNLTVAQAWDVAVDGVLTTTGA